jgi:hypothetical protein
MVLSRSQISELITTFQELNPWGTKDEFLEFMGSEVYARSKAAKRAAAADPDHARTISYADPVGEEATWNVYKAGRRGRGRTAA